MARRVPCRICEQGAGRTVVLEAKQGRYARFWQVQVCQDCWRAFEAMVESAAVAVQPALGDRRPWFL